MSETQITCLQSSCDYLCVTVCVRVCLLCHCLPKFQRVKAFTDSTAILEPFKGGKLRLFSGNIEGEFLQLVRHCFHSTYTMALIIRPRRETRKQFKGGDQRDGQKVWLPSHVILLLAYFQVTFLQLLWRQQSQMIMLNYDWFKLKSLMISQKEHSRVGGDIILSV